MATIKKRGNSYLIRCYDGYDQNGKQIERTMTWKIPAGMTEKKAEKEALREAALFEERVRAGQTAEKKIKFADFSDLWFKNYAEIQLRPLTVARYYDLMKRITPAIGHLYLDRIRPTNLMTLYKDLSEIKKAHSFKSNTDLRAYLKSVSMTQTKLSELSKVSTTTIKAVINGDNINEDSAFKIALALNIPIEKLFDKVNTGRSLSNKTILEHHRLISVILNTAVEWQYIPANPAERVKPPKASASEAEYLDDQQAIHLLDLLQEQPIQYRTAIEVLLFTGMRRGELLGLNWSDIDFESNTITIQRSSLYMPEKGIFEDETKNRSSRRVIKVPQSAISALSSYKKWQAKERLKHGTLWMDTDRIFTTVEGKPLHPDTLSGWFSKFIKTTDLPQIHIHSLRHTNASLQIANGVSVTTVAKTLGHANSSTTTKIYAHAIQSAEAASAEMLDNLLKPSKKHA